MEWSTVRADAFGRGSIATHATTVQHQHLWVPPNTGKSNLPCALDPRPQHRTDLPAHTWPSLLQNGYLMSTFALVRATFLTFAFPSIIDYGRKWYTHTEVKQTGRAPLKRGVSSYGSTSNIHGGSRHGRQPPAYDTLSIASDPSTASSSSNDDGVDEDAPHSGYGKDSDHQSGFDLAFLRWSCLADALLTSVLTFSGKSWQMYIGEPQRGGPKKFHPKTDYW